MENQNNTPPVSETPSEQVESQENEEVESQESEGQEQPSEQEKLAALEAKNPADMTKSEKKAHEKLIKKFKLKVDGAEEDFELDMNNEEEVKKHLQMSRASSKRMQESASLRKSAEEFIELLRTNPRKVLTDPSINVDLKNLAQEIINQELEDAAKTPEQLEKEKLQKELQELKDKYKKDEDERKDREFKKLQAEHEEKIQSNIESALSSGQIPKTPYTVRKMAEMMMLALENDIELEPKDIVPLLRKQMNSDIKELFSASSDDVLEELLGKDNISRLRKRTIAKVKQSQVAQTASSVKPTGTVKKEEAPSKKISVRDFLKG